MMLVLDVCHSSEIRGLCLIKCYRDTLQNLPYFWNMKTHVDFSFLILCYFIFPLMNVNRIVSLEHFIEHKPHISEECTGISSLKSTFFTNSLVMTRDQFKMLMCYFDIFLNCKKSFKETL